MLSPHPKPRSDCATLCDTFELYGKRFSCSPAVSDLLHTSRGLWLYNMIKAEVVVTLRVVFRFRLAGGIRNWYALLISFSPTTHPAAHHRIQADAPLEGNTWTFNLMKRMESSQASVHLHGYMDSFGCKDETGPGQGRVQCCCLQLLCVGEKTKIHKGAFN